MTSERVQAAWTALGMVVVVEVTEADALPRARQIVEDELAAADAAYSPVRRDTELARVEAAGGRRVHVGARLCEAVAAALGAAEMTGGLVDASAVIGVVERRRGGGVRAVPRPARRLVACDRASGTIRLGRGVRLDLGATGKALIADRAARRIARPGLGVLVSVGGDLATAGQPPPGGWPVRVADDHRAHTGGRLISLSTGGLATSSTAVRGAHVVDPRTGRPAAGPWRTASVAAATCVEANAASTAALILGDAAPAWLGGASLPSLLVAHDGTAVRVAGWPA